MELFIHEYVYWIFGGMFFVSGIIMYGMSGKL